MKNAESEGDDHDGVLPTFGVGDLVDDIGARPNVGARLRFGVCVASTAASGNDRATVEVDGMQIPYDGGYTPFPGDVVYWLEDEQRRVVVGKLA